MGFQTASIWIKVAFFCLLLSLVLFVIGFATRSWMSNDHRDYYGYAYTDDWGLWERHTCQYRSGCITMKLNQRSLTFFGLEGKEMSEPSQQEHTVEDTSYQRLCNVMTLRRRWFDVSQTSCVCWVISIDSQNGRHFFFWLNCRVRA